MNITDDGDLEDPFSGFGGILVDKGYQGIQKFLRGNHPAKKPQGDILSASEERFNKKVASDRIIVENFFGRSITLWSVSSHK